MPSSHAQNLWDVLPTPLAGAWRELRFADAAAAGHLGSVFLERMLQFAALIEFGRLRLHASQMVDNSPLERLHTQLSRNERGNPLAAGGWFHLLLEVWKAQQKAGVTALMRPANGLLQALVSRRNDAVHRNDIDSAFLDDLGQALGQIGAFTAGRLVWFSGQTQFQNGETCSQVRICVGTDSKGQPEELRWQAASNIEPGIYWMSVALDAGQMLVPLHGLVECPSLPLTTNTWTVAAAIIPPAQKRAAKSGPFPWAQLSVVHGRLELAEHRMTPDGAPRALLRPTTPAIPSWNVSARSALHLGWNAEDAGPHRAGGTQRVFVGTTGAPAAAEEYDDWTGDYAAVGGNRVRRLARFPFAVAVLGLVAGLISIVVDLAGGGADAPDTSAPVAVEVAPTPSTADEPAPRAAPAEPTPVPAVVAAQPAATTTAAIPRPAPTPTPAAVVNPPTGLQARVPAQATATAPPPSVTSFGTSICTPSQGGAFRYAGTGSDYRIYWGQPGDLTPSSLWRRFRTYDERYERNPEVLRSSGDLLLIRAHFCVAAGCAGDEHSAIVYLAVRRAPDRSVQGFYYSNFDRSEGPLRGAVGSTTYDCSTLSEMDPALRCMLDRMLARRTATSDREGQATLESVFDFCTP